MKYLTNRSKIQSITISTELEEDTVFVKQELAPLIMRSTEASISYITGGDPVTQVDLIVIGPSSFSRRLIDWSKQLFSQVDWSKQLFFSTKV